MKKIGVIQLGFAAAGTFLGAGFISGQEIWSFFGCFGAAGIPGFAVNAVLCGIVFYIAVALVRKTGVEEMGLLMTTENTRFLTGAVDLLQFLLLYGVGVIMTAGFSALLHELTGIPAWAAGLLFSAGVLAMTFRGIGGLTTVFSVLVPAASLCSVLVAAVLLSRAGFRFQPPAGAVSPLMPNLCVSVPNYAAYNLLACVAIMIPYARVIPDSRTLRRGMILGMLMLTVLAGSMIAAFAAYPEAGRSEIPMAALAAEVHPAMHLLYSLMMGFAMFASTLGTVIALIKQAVCAVPRVGASEKPFTAAVVFSAWALSLFGFGTLVGIVYPLFGYASIPLFAILVRNGFRNRTPAEKETPARDGK